MICVDAWAYTKQWDINGLYLCGVKDVRCRWGESEVKGQFHLQCSAFFFPATSCGSCAAGCGDRQRMHLHQQQTVHLRTLIFLKSQVPVDASGRLLSSPASCQKCVALARSLSKWVRLVSNAPWRLKGWKHSRFRCQRSCDSLKTDLDELKRNI